MSEDVKRLKRALERWAIFAGRARKLSLELKQERERKETQRKLE